VTEKNVVFGNPWHGKLAAGTIEVVDGVPVSEIAFDGVTHSVKTVPGILGDTRYHLSHPGRLEPLTPPALSSLGGAFKRDFVLYSASMRYSPLNDQNILEVEESLLWDTAAERWRKMKVSVPAGWLPGWSTRPPSGTPVSAWSAWRGVVYGEFNRGTVSPSWTSVGGGNLVYNDKFDPFRVATTGNGWDWRLPCSTSFDCGRDGKSVLVLLTAYPEGSYPSPAAGSERIASVFRFTFNSDGTVAGALSELLPTPVDSVFSWTATHTGSPYLVTWTDGAPPGKMFYAYVQPVHVTYYGHIEDAASRRVIAAHDGAGNAKVMYIRDVNNRDLIGSLDGGADLGFGMSGLVDIDPDPPLADPPAEVAGVPPMPGEGTFTINGGPAVLPYNEAASDPADYFNIVPQTMSDSSTDTADRALRIVDELGTVIHEWTDPTMLATFPLALGWTRLTNNVASIELGGVSIARVGPGAVDATVMDLPVYASYNPRTGQVVSSNAPIGFV